MTKPYLVKNIDRSAQPSDWRINILINKDNLPFESDKDYRMIGGMIQENFGDRGVLMYDLGSLGIDLANLGVNANSLVKGNTLNKLIMEALDTGQTVKSYQDTL